MNERYILGCKINDISFDQAIHSLKELALKQGTHYVVTPNPEICLKGYHDEKLQYITKQADLSLPDGFGLKIGGVILNSPINNTVTGIDISLALIKIAHDLKYRVLLLGGKGKSGTTALENLKQQFSGIDVYYLNGGNFDKEGNPEDLTLIDTINQINPRIIFVNLGAPKQEYFMFNNRASIQNSLMLGVGGTIDFLSGSIQRAPKFFQTFHLEFLYRLIQEPQRWRRILRATLIFPLTCIIWKIRNTLFYRKNVVGMIINSQKQVMLVKRSRERAFNPQDHWQLPQGGVEKWQTEDQAILKEMKEELGLSNLQILSKVTNCYRYKWGKSAELLQPFKGQQQSLYLLKFNGNNEEIKPDQKEIAEYRFVNKDHLLSLAHHYRKAIIEIGLREFKEYL